MLDRQASKQDSKQSTMILSGHLRPQAKCQEQTTAAADLASQVGLRADLGAAGAEGALRLDVEACLRQEPWEGRLPEADQQHMAGRVLLLVAACR